MKTDRMARTSAMADSFRLSKNGSGEEPHDSVNNPHHYTAAGISPLEFIEAQGMGRDFCLGNAIKYIGRAGKKSGVSELEDLKKARWYLQRWIDNLQADSRRECSR